MKHLKRLLTRHISVTRTEPQRPFNYTGRHRAAEICSAPAVLSATETREAVSA